MTAQATRRSKRKQGLEPEMVSDDDKDQQQQMQQQQQEQQPQQKQQQQQDDEPVAGPSGVKQRCVQILHQHKMFFMENATVFISLII